MPSTTRLPPRAIRRSSRRPGPTTRRPLTPSSGSYPKSPNIRTGSSRACGRTGTASASARRTASSAPTSCSRCASPTTRSTGSGTRRRSGTTRVTRCTRCSTRFSVVVRRPLPGRLQPYLTAGYGMVIVFPGLSVNAVPVTKNALAVGGGLEWFIRNDLAAAGRPAGRHRVWGAERPAGGRRLRLYAGNDWTRVLSLDSAMTGGSLREGITTIMLKRSSASRIRHVARDRSPRPSRCRSGSRAAATARRTTSSSRRPRPTRSCS